MGLFSGLESMGITGLDREDLFATQEDKKEAVKKEKQAAPKPKPEPKKLTEEECLLERSFTCPVCEKPFKSLAVKSNRGKMRATERDLRPIFDDVDQLKYGVVSCPVCGYSALNQFFATPLAAASKQAIGMKVGNNYKAKKPTPTYSYQDAYERYQLSLVCAMLRGSKIGERAFICLRTGWLLRSWSEHLDPDDIDYDSMKKDLAEKEREFLDKALQGFQAAVMKERYPICGMDESTLDYLMAALFADAGQYSDALKLCGKVLTSRVAGERVKDKARTLKEEIAKEKKA